LKRGLRPESIDEWKTVRRMTDHSPLASRDFAHNFPHQIEIHGVTIRRQFGPLCCEELDVAFYNSYLATYLDPILSNSPARKKGFH
jgi:hypothetical protein